MTRDLQRDLEICRNAKRDTLTFAIECREGWLHAVLRAIEAEERIDRLEHELRMIHDHYRGGDGPNG